MDYNEEQKNIVEKVKNNCESTEGWGKHDGDVCCGIIKLHIKNYLPSTKKVVGPHIFIKNIPNELDLLVINKEAKPDDFVTCFNIDDVNMVIEIKKSGPIPEKNKPHPLEKTLNPYKCFMLCDRKGNLIKDSWETFLKELKLRR